MATNEFSKALRAHHEVQRHLAAADVIVKAPGFQEMLKQRNRFGDLFAIQTKVSDLISPALLQQMQEQNKRIGEMLDSSGMRKALLSIDFKLPEGWAEQAAVYREQFEATAAEIEAEAEAANTDVEGGALAWIAEERDAIIISLQRIGFAMEGFAYLPRSPIPPIVGYLVLALAVLAEVANEKLGEDDAEQ